MTKDTKENKVRSTLRDAILTDIKTTVKAEIVNFFGQDIEIRQPTVGQMEKAVSAEDKSSSITDMLIAYAFVPGTEDKVFETADVDTLKTLPYNEDVQEVMKAITRLTGVDVKAAAKK